MARLLDRCRQRRARRLTGCVAALVVVTLSCDDGVDDVAELRDPAAEVIAASDVTVQREPHIQWSKGLEYITADGTRPGDLDAVVAEVTDALDDSGWDVTTSEPIDTSHRLVATRSDVAVQVLVAGALGTNRAPAGAQWVQLSVAHPDDRLTWTTAAT